MEELIQCMKSYVSLSPEAETAVREMGEHQRYSRRTYIRENGHRWREIFFTISGCIRHYYINDEGVEITCDFSLDVEFFTDFQSLKQEIPSRYDFVALENCEFICIPNDKLTQAYQHYPSLERFGRLMAETTANRISRMAHSLLMESPETRYQNLLHSRPELIQRIPQKYIANYLGIKPESLSRLKKRIYDRSKS